MSSIDKPFHLSASAGRTRRQSITRFMALAIERPDLISLAAGLVDDPTLPSEEVLELTRQLLSRPGLQGRTPLQYGTTAGLSELRETLLGHLAGLDGVKPETYEAGPENLVMTTGSQQMLFLLTEVLVDPGDIVITAWPSYFVYTGALQTFGARVHAVESDEEGMVPDSLEQTLKDIERAGLLERVKIVYTVPYHKNPTGVTLTASRRPQILETVRRFSKNHRILLLEDAAYRELTYHGQTPASIRSLDAGGQFVALAMTFSKPFAPGLKTGYGLLPDDLIEPVLLQKGSQDFGSPGFNQHLLLAAMQSGLYDKHVQTLCRRYTQKLDALLGALETHLSGVARWTRPQGGLYVWVSLPDSFDTSAEAPLFQQCMQEGVIYVPGADCYPEAVGRTPPRNQMRLSFGSAEIDRIHEGVARLARALNKVQ